MVEVETLTDAEALAAWPKRVLPQKNQLATSDAQTIETAFAAKLDEFSDDGATGADLPGPAQTVGSTAASPAMAPAASRAGEPAKDALPIG
jgi:hypothetical protein